MKSQPLYILSSKNLHEVIGWQKMCDTSFVDNHSLCVRKQFVLVCVGVLRPSQQRGHVEPVS